MPGADRFSVINAGFRGGRHCGSHGNPLLHCSPGALVASAKLRMELFAVTAVAASLFLLLLFMVFISVYIGSSPSPQPLSQNC